MVDYKMEIITIDNDEVSKNEDGSLKGVIVDYIEDDNVDNLISRFVEYLDIWEDSEFKDVSIKSTIKNIMEELKRVDEEYYECILSVKVDDVICFEK